MQEKTLNTEMFIYNSEIIGSSLKCQQLRKYIDTDPVMLSTD